MACFPVCLPAAMLVVSSGYRRQIRWVLYTVTSFDVRTELKIGIQNRLTSLAGT